MDIHQAKTAQDVEKILAKKNPQAIQVGLFDLNGILRGKYISVQKFLGALKNGFGFCDVVLSSDCDDQLIDGMKISGWQTGYPDAPVVIDPTSGRILPYIGVETPIFLAEFSGYASGLCPRSLLKKVIKKAQSMGYFPFGGMEFEFTVFAEDRESVREKNYKNLETLTPGNFGYSLLRSGATCDFYHGLMDWCHKLEMPLEGFHTEIGPGVLETALQATDGLRAADNAALFKTTAKIYAQQMGCMASFMAKWNENIQGQSGHIHLSLKDSKGNNVFFADENPHQMSQVMQHFLAGQQALMPYLLPMVAPNVNSFVRLQPGFWAPTAAAWGVDNRTCALRVIAGSSKAQRIEYRIPGADANPYLAFAAALASGLYGIENELMPTDPIVGNAYEAKHDDAIKLPVNLGDAVIKFKSSEPVSQLFGNEFVNEYAKTRLWEQQMANKAVTDWQRERYFEII